MAVVVCGENRWDKPSGSRGGRVRRGVVGIRHGGQDARRPKKRARLAGYTRRLRLAGGQKYQPDGTGYCLTALKAAIRK